MTSRTAPPISSELLARLDLVFGAPDDPMEQLETRARELLSDQRAIVWEGDAGTFEFTFVSASAEEILGFPRRRWTTEPTFWIDTVVHPEDREQAAAFCALATGKGLDHDFDYRAVTADGRVLWLHDIVRIVMGRHGVATRLRGVMLDVTNRHREPAIAQSMPRTV